MTLPRLRFAPLLIALAAIAGIAYYALASAPTERSRVDAAALSYSRQQMVWLQGPTIRSTQFLRLGRLSAALARSVPRTVANNINVPELEQTYGRKRMIALVILTGVYNSLPPDEGVNLHGDAAVILDSHTNRLLLLMN